MSSCLLSGSCTPKPCRRLPIWNGMSDSARARARKFFHRQKRYFVAFATYKAIRCRFYSELSIQFPAFQPVAATKYQLLLRWLGFACVRLAFGYWLPPPLDVAWAAWGLSPPMNAKCRRSDLAPMRKGRSIFSWMRWGYTVGAKASPIIVPPHIAAFGTLFAPSFGSWLRGRSIQARFSASARRLEGVYIT